MQRRDRDLARISRHRLSALTAPRPVGPEPAPATSHARTTPRALTGPSDPAPTSRPRGGPPRRGPDRPGDPTRRSSDESAIPWTATGWVPQSPPPAPVPTAVDGSISAALPALDPTAVDGSISAALPALDLTAVDGLARASLRARERDLTAVAPGALPRVDPAATDGRTLTTAALQVAAAGYTAAHGDPTTRAPVPRRRVRWAISWRLCLATGAVLLLVAGAVALRASALAPGPAVVLPTPAPSGSPPPASAAPVAEVVVDVVGAVAAPGVVRLAQGSRVVDAIAAAGGATAEAEVSSLNLARVLVDGEQIVVPRPGEQPAGTNVSEPPGGDSLVNLNTADASVLDGLPGIGPVLADRIVSHRDDRPFTTVDELADVAGIGPTLLERLRELVRV